MQCNAMLEEAGGKTRFYRRVVRKEKKDGLL